MNKKRFTIIIVILALMLGGCSIAIDSYGDINDSGNVNGSGNVAADTEDIAALTRANHEFAWDIFKALRQEDEKNEVFISPFSISTMVTMALNGAAGDTKQAIEETLHYQGISTDVLNGSYEALTNKITSMDKKVTLEIANSIWIRKGFDVKSSFLDVNKKYLSAEVQTLDFSDPKSAGMINDWISNKTKKMIPHMIDPPIEEDLMMYLINAIYFKGTWKDEFKAQNTMQKDFYAIDGKVDKVSMMHRNGRIDYIEQEGFQAIRLPYGNGSTSMIVILPQEIDKWLNKMNAEKWNEVINGFTPANQLAVALPKFKIEYRNNELIDVLATLGMGVAFSEQADFSGIADNLYISKVMHKAIIDVNEKGTEAAAVTVGGVTATSYSEPKTFTANRPFIYAITDIDGNILFIGMKLYGER